MVNVTLSPETPEGRFEEKIFFITNDREGFREIPYLVQGVVGQPITVTPATVFLGFLQPGESSPVKSATVSGSRPFTVTKITSSHPDVKIDFDFNANTNPRMFFAVPVQYVDPGEGKRDLNDGALNATVTLETNIPGQSPAFNVTMRVQTESAKEDKENAEE